MSWPPTARSPTSAGRGAGLAGGADLAGARLSREQLAPVAHASQAHLDATHAPARKQSASTLQGAPPRGGGGGGSTGHGPGAGAAPAVRVLAATSISSSISAMACSAIQLPRDVHALVVPRALREGQGQCEFEVGQSVYSAPGGKRPAARTAIT